MNFKTAVGTCLRDKYVDFNGRASRSEFWWYMLFATLVSMALNVVDLALVRMGLLSLIMDKWGVFGTLYLFIIIIPTIAVTARRMHDLGRSGWWQVLLVLPLIGLLIVYWAAKKGTDGPNPYGADPLGGVGAEPATA